MTSEIRDRQSNVQIVEVGLRRLVVAIECIVRAVKKFSVGYAVQQISNMLTLENRLAAKCARYGPYDMGHIVWMSICA